MAEKIKGQFHTFVFVGIPTIAKDREKFVTSQVSDKGYKWSKVKFGVKVGESNTQFLELMGGFNTKKENIIRTFDAEGNELQIDWTDRNDKGIISSVSDMRKYKMNFTSSDEKESVVFLAEYDAVQYIVNNLGTDKRVVVTGDVTFERFVKDGNAQVSMKYHPRKIRLAKDTEEDKAEVTMSFVYDNESYETTESNKVGVTGYVTTYAKALKQNIFVPVMFTLDYDHLISKSPVKFTEDKLKMLKTLYNKYLTCDRGEYYLTQWKVEPFNGTTTEEFTEADLTEEQKFLIEIGVLSFEQAKKDARNGKVGDRINELKLIRPTTKFEDEKTGEKKVSELTKYVEDDFFIPETIVEDKNDLFKSPTVENDWDSDSKLLDSLFPPF